MKYFTLIQVYQDYDYVEDAKPIATFKIEQDALNLMEKMKTEESLARQNRMKYIENYIESIVPLKMSYQEWVGYHKRFNMEINRYFMPDNFKRELKDHLWRCSDSFENYSPPALTISSSNLFIIEVNVDE